MQTIDIHAHLLSSEVSFNRFYDKVMIKLFAKNMGYDIKKLLKNPYQEYTKNLINSIKNSNHISKSVLFGVDARVDYRGNIIDKDPTVCATNEDLLELYQNNKDIIIPFFSINPMRRDALDLIDKYYDLGFKGAKFLQNYWAVDTKDTKYRAYFQKLKDKNIPLIIHIGNEGSIESFKEYESIDMLYYSLDIGLKVISAHMALSHEKSEIFRVFSSNPKYFNSEYFKLLEMLETHDNLYADISAILTPTRAKVLRHLSKQNNIHHKLLYGTDYPVAAILIETK